jgi:hypothetical protein
MANRIQTIVTLAVPDNLEIIESSNDNSRTPKDFVFLGNRSFLASAVEAGLA